MFFAVTACCLNYGHAQTPPPVTDGATAAAKNDSELLGKLDQPVEQNRQLEKQNKELLEQVQALVPIIWAYCGLGALSTPPRQHAAML